MGLVPPAPRPKLAPLDAAFEWSQENERQFWQLVIGGVLYKDCEPDGTGRFWSLESFRKAKILAALDLFSEADEEKKARKLWPKDKTRPDDAADRIVAIRESAVYQKASELLIQRFQEVRKLASDEDWLNFSAPLMWTRLTHIMQTGKERSALRAAEAIADRRVPKVARPPGETQDRALVIPESVIQLIADAASVLRAKALPEPEKDVTPDG